MNSKSPMDKHHLHLLINEEIYVVKEKNKGLAKTVKEPQKEKETQKDDDESFSDHTGGYTRRRRCGGCRRGKEARKEQGSKNENETRQYFNEATELQGIS